MGAIAKAIVAYAQPLLDQTDGSLEEVNKAFSISQLCWNISLLPEDDREPVLGKMGRALGMDEEQLEHFRSSFVEPMIQRHHEMFPQMHGEGPTRFSARGPSPIATSFLVRPRAMSSVEAYPGTGRYAPCPCDSGLKYKFCCGKKRR